MSEDEVLDALIKALATHPDGQMTIAPFMATHLNIRGTEWMKYRDRLAAIGAGRMIGSSMMAADGCSKTNPESRWLDCSV